MINKAKNEGGMINSSTHILFVRDDRRMYNLYYDHQNFIYEEWDCVFQVYIHLIIVYVRVTLNNYIVSDITGFNEARYVITGTWYLI